MKLDKKIISDLTMIPIKRCEIIHGKTFLIVHYHLHEKDKLLPIDECPSAVELDKIFKDSNVDVVCFGHHHFVHHFKSKDRLYLNPGSLGCNHRPLAPYAIVQVREAGQIDFSFKEVPYENRNFLLSYEKLNVPAKDII